MKKINYLRHLMVVMGFVFVFPGQVSAGGGVSSLFKLTSSAASATVGKSVTVYVYAYKYACNDYPGSTTTNSKPFACLDGSQSYERPSANDYYWIKVTGSNNTISGLTTHDGHDAVQTDANGKAQFTISSTKAETKTITVTNPYASDTSEFNKTLNVTFKNVVVATPAPVVVPAPDPPKASVEVQGKTAEGTIALRNKQPLVLKGTAVANATIKLYIFSESKQETVTADANGNWTYIVSGLEPGDHHVEAEVTDPKTGKTSARATLAAFSVAQPVAAPKPPKVEAPSSTGAWLLLAGEALAVIAAAGGLWWFLRYKKHKKPTAPKTPTDTPDQDQASTDTSV